MWLMPWKRVVCFTALFAGQRCLAVERRPLMRRVSRHSKHWQPHWEPQSRAHQGVLPITTPMPPIHPKPLGAVPSQGAATKGSVVVGRLATIAPAHSMLDSSMIIGSLGIGDEPTNIAMPRTLVKTVAGLADDAKQPAAATTAAPIAATTAAPTTATAAATAAPVPVAAVPAPAAPAATPVAAPVVVAPAPADENSGGIGIGTIIVILIIAILVVLGASVIARFYMAKKNAGRLGDVKDSDSQYWKSAKARQTYRKSQLGVPKLPGQGGDADSTSDQDNASGQGRGLIQEGDASASPAASSYRSRRDRTRARSVSMDRRRDDEDEEDAEPAKKAGSYRGRRMNQQVKRNDTGGSTADDIAV